jgi:ferredoxin
MKIKIDPEVCQGHLRCYDFAPELFGVDAIGHGMVLHDEVPPELEAKAAEAVFVCPERAITAER